MNKRNNKYFKMLIVAFLLLMTGRSFVKAEDIGNQPIAEIQEEQRNIDIGKEVTFDLCMQNDINADAFDVTIQYSDDKLEYSGIEKVPGVKILKCKKQNNEIRIVIKKDSVHNGIMKYAGLKFKGKKIGRGEAKISKLRVSNNKRQINNLNISSKGSVIVGDYINRKVYFNGTTYAYADKFKGYDFSKPYTMEFTITNEGGDYRGVVNTSFVSGGVDFRFGREINGTCFQFYDCGHETYIVVPLNEVSHIAITKDEKGNVTMYRNGCVMNRMTGVLGGGIGTTGMYMGRFSTAWSDHSPSRSYRGYMDEFRVWNVARTQEEIQDTMNTELQGNEEGLVCYYDFNEGEGNTLYDRTGNGYDAHIYNPTWIQN